MNKGNENGEFLLLLNEKFILSHDFDRHAFEMKGFGNGSLNCDRASERQLFNQGN